MFTKKASGPVRKEDRKFPESEIGTDEQRLTKTDRVAAFLNQFSIFFFYMKENLIGYLVLNFHEN